MVLVNVSNNSELFNSRKGNDFVRHLDKWVCHYYNQNYNELIIIYIINYL